MCILDLKVEYLNWFVKLKKIYTLNGCRTPIFGVENIAGIEIASINPTFALYLERVRFGALEL